MIEEQIISKMIDEDNVNAVLKYNVDKGDFPTLSDTFEYVISYRKAHGATPDYRTVVAEFEDFDYQPNVQEPFGGLATRLKQNSAKRKAFNLLQNQAGLKFKELRGDKFVKWMKEEIDSIDQVTSSAFSLGTNWATSGEERKQRYMESKVNRERNFIPTPYPSLNNALGAGFELGDYILLTAFTNRGKSWIATHLGVTAWRKGFGVLHYSPELSTKQQESRLDTLDGHFNNTELRRGVLKNEGTYLKYLDTFSAENSVPYIFKCMKDLPKGLTVDLIESDLEANPDIKFVIIDGFNLISHKGGKSKSGREAMAGTSRILRQVFGRQEVAGLIVHQVGKEAEKENKKVDEAGTRILKPPSLEQYSETIAVIQDAATVITFDACDGLGQLFIAKAREPSVGTVIDLRCDFNRGYIQEPELTEMF